ncbi:MAG: PTS system mannose/fructose/sorbose family transporter subunit IID [Brevinema sp.]
MKKINLKSLRHSYYLWIFHSTSALNLKTLEASGFCLALSPILKDLYEDNLDEFKKSVSRHCVFYNTEPQIGIVINGIVAQMEEQKRNIGNNDENQIHSLKTSLMGPIAAIGDSLIPGTIIPILVSLALFWASKGLWQGALFYAICYLGIMIVGMRFLFFLGYQKGIDSIKTLTGTRALLVRDSLTRLCLLMIGGVAVHYIKIPNIELTPIPPILGLVGLTLLCYFLMAKKGLSRSKLTGLLIIVSIFIVLFNVDH